MAPNDRKSPVVYHRILLKLSGEALRADRHLEIDPDVVKKIADEIQDIQQLGVQVRLLWEAEISSGDYLQALEAWIG